MVIRAEDARLLSSMPAMRRAYGELHAQNRELIGECVAAPPPLQSVTLGELCAVLFSLLHRPFTFHASCCVHILSHSIVRSPSCSHTPSSSSNRNAREHRYAKRATNHTQLLEALKEVNQMIQKAARLRAGKHKAEVVAACRAAIQANNIAALFKIIQSGRASG
jgi:hypothetical protein